MNTNDPQTPDAESKNTPAQQMLIRYAQVTALGALLGLIAGVWIQGDIPRLLPVVAVSIGICIALTFITDIVNALTRISDKWTLPTEPPSSSSRPSHTEAVDDLNDESKP
ncbi:MAG: hypothetical protein ACYDDR_13545 [Acidithiobacillus ferrivorans]